MSDPTSNCGTCPKCYSTLKLRTMEEHLEKCHESLDNKKNKKKKGLRKSNHALEPTIYYSRRCGYKKKMSDPFLYTQCKKCFAIFSKKKIEKHLGKCKEM